MDCCKLYFGMTKLTAVVKTARWGCVVHTVPELLMTRAFPTRMFGMVLEKIVIPEVQKVSGPVEKKICAVGITKVLTECPAMMDTEYTKLW